MVAAGQEREEESAAKAPEQHENEDTAEPEADKLLFVKGDEV